MTWLHIIFAPRDGRPVRVRTDEGTTCVARFSEPCWWVLGNGAARIADAVLYDGGKDIILAEQFEKV